MKGDRIIPTADILKSKLYTYKAEQKKYLDRLIDHRMHEESVARLRRELIAKRLRKFDVTFGDQFRARYVFTQIYICL